MDIKMIAVDLDGTLFTSSKEILPETLSALERASAMGIEIVPATGRPFHGVSEKVTELEFVNYILTCNGAAIYNRRTGECLYEQPMSWEKGAEILTALKGLNISIDAFINGYSYKERSQINFIDSLALSQVMKDYIKKTRLYVDDLIEFVSSEKYSVQKITLNFAKNPDGTSLDRDETKARLDKISDIAVVSGGDNNLEITESTINKGISLVNFGKRLGIDRSQIMAFGDSGNDLEMLKAAGFGVAMGNSEKAVHDIADYVTLSNNDNGIGDAIEKLILNKK